VFQLKKKLCGIAQLWLEMSNILDIQKMGKMIYTTPSDNPLSKKNSKSINPSASTPARVSLLYHLKTLGDLKIDIHTKSRLLLFFYI
jgi:hypothetical protein